MLVLASGSPRRAALLTQLGLAYSTHSPSIEESIPEGSRAASATLSNARRKAQAVWALVEPRAHVLSADTVGVMDGAILGKPGHAEDARRMLRQLSGRTHEVVTGVVVVDPAGRSLEGTETAKVTFAPLSEAKIAAYLATGEPLDKACAYAIQGAGAAFVERVEGDYTNVVGLPLRLTLALLHAARFPLPPHLVP